MKDMRYEFGSSLTPEGRAEFFGYEMATEGQPYENPWSLITPLGAAYLFGYSIGSSRKAIINV